ncbi:MAG: hypothetical protein LAO09_09500 [Acidobacteriia bacterium]|nr:hypothetical protein [Terriglobia bacterium]
MHAPLRVFLPRLQPTLLETLTPAEHKEDKLVCPRCGGEGVDRDGFDLGTARRSA